MINGSIWPPNYQTSRSSKIEPELARELITLQFVLDGIIPAKACCFGSPKPGYQKFAEVVAPITNYSLYKNGPDFVTDCAPTIPLLPWTHPRPLTEILEIPTTNELSLFAFHHISLYLQGMPP